MRGLVASGLLLLAVSAAADTPKPLKIVDDYSLALRGHSIIVRHGKTEATVMQADGLTAVHYDKTTDKVTIDYDTPSCMIPTTTTVSLAYLKARLENEPAFVLHRKKDYKHALDGFQRAIAADPTWEIPAYNAASAQQQLGDKAGAVATLAPWLKQHPIRTFVQIHVDPELAPLADRDEVKMVGAKHAGDVVVTSDGIKGDVAYSSELKLVAVTRLEGGWGGPQYLREVHVFDATGAIVATLPLVNFDETSEPCPNDSNRACYTKAAKKPLADRAALVQQILRELGFTAAKIEAGDRAASDDGKIKIRFPKHKLGLVSVDGAFRVLGGNTEVAHGAVADARLHDATLVESANAIVMWSGHPGAEGCMSTDPTAVQLVALPAKP